MIETAEFEAGYQFGLSREPLLYPSLHSEEWMSGYYEARLDHQPQIVITFKTGDASANDVRNVVQRLMSQWVKDGNVKEFEVLLNPTE